MVIGPLELCVESSSAEVHAWCQALGRPRDSARRATRRQVQVRIRTTPEVFAGPAAPELHEHTLAHHGWRAERRTDHYEASVSVAGDPARRGPRRVAALLRVIVESELNEVALAFHAAALSDGRRAWVFSGARGAGKTTLALEQPEAQRLGDDHALVVRSDAGWTVYPTPFSGREGVRAEGDAAPLAAVVLLSQAPVTQVERLAPADALPRLIPLVIQAGLGVTHRQRALDLLVRLSEEVPVLTLGRRLGHDPLEALQGWCP